MTFELSLPQFRITDRYCLEVKQGQNTGLISKLNLKDLIKF